MSLSWGKPFILPRYGFQSCVFLQNGARVPGLVQNKDPTVPQRAESKRALSDTLKDTQGVPDNDDVVKYRSPFPSKITYFVIP